MDQWRRTPLPQPHRQSRSDAAAPGGTILQGRTLPPPRRGFNGGLDQLKTLQGPWLVIQATDRHAAAQAVAGRGPLPIADPTYSPMTPSVSNQPVGPVSRTFASPAQVSDVGNYETSRGLDEDAERRARCDLHPFWGGSSIRLTRALATCPTSDGFPRSLVPVLVVQSGRPSTRRTVPAPRLRCNRSCGRLSGPFSCCSRKGCSRGRCGTRLSL